MKKKMHTHTLPLFQMISGCNVFVFLMKELYDFINFICIV